MKSSLKSRQPKNGTVNYELARTQLHKKLARLHKEKVAKEAKLLKRIKKNLKKLEELLYWAGYSEDLMYRFYHQSFKVYRIQELTQQMVAEFQRLAPRQSLMVSRNRSTGNRTRILAIR